MTKRADLGLKRLVCTTSCTLLKIAKKWCAQCENDKTCWSSSENALLHKLVHFAKNCLKVVGQVRKWQNILIPGEKTALYKLVRLAEKCKKWYSQCKNDKTCWSWAENADLYKLVHFFVKSLKSGAPSEKITKGADIMLKTLLCTNLCTLLKKAKKWCTQCENDKRFWSRAENTVSHKLVHFAESL